LRSSGVSGVLLIVKKNKHGRAVIAYRQDTASGRTMIESIQELPMSARTAPARSRASKPQPARLEARISQELHLIVKRAAELQGRTMTDFVVHALEVAASKAIDQTSRVRLSLADQQAFADALITPPKPNAALKRAFAKADKLLTPS
jgi:uncharacterized protein (DUF1778 family)